jgi:hypothetical protein
MDVTLWLAMAVVDAWWRRWPSGSHEPGKTTPADDATWALVEAVPRDVYRLMYDEHQRRLRERRAS